jgi:hypothetical protein
VRILLDLKACGINTYGSADSTGLRWLDFGGKNPTGAWARLKLEAIAAETENNTGVTIFQYDIVSDS